MTARRSHETPAWQFSLAEALGEALPRLLQEKADPLVQELIAALTAALCRGEVLLDLQGEAPEGVDSERWPDAHRRALESSRLCLEPDGPLMLVGHQLAWRRWMLRQEAVVAALLERARPGDGNGPVALPDDDGSDPVDPALERLDPLQRRAVQAALTQRLVLILGGPGTGKTSTVAQLLAAVRRHRPEARVHLAAPTGKAAARLRAATGGGEACTTLHRLLESRGDGFARGRHHPLELDLLVIDELSMVDLELMEAVLDALPSACRLVLVGDPAQLPPIAPGPVLQALEQPHLAAALAPVRIELRTTYRNDGAIALVAGGLRAFLADQGLHAPASASPQAASHQAASRQTSSRQAASRQPASALEAVRPLLERLEPSANLAWQQASRRSLPAAALQRMQEHQRQLAASAAGCWPGREESWAELLAERDRLLVLSPLRRGRWGIDALHRALLGRAADPAAVAISGLPSGTPLLCRRNLPDLGLANGDIGVLVVQPSAAAGEDSARRILFGQDAPLWFHPAQLGGALEPALALTVHKAQGSEAREVVVLLEDPAAAEPRLLYTALTRAREWALLITASTLD